MGGRRVPHRVKPQTEQRSEKRHSGTDSLKRIPHKLESAVSATRPSDTQRDGPIRTDRRCGRERRQLDLDGGVQPRLERMREDARRRRRRGRGAEVAYDGMCEQRALRSPVTTYRRLSVTWALARQEHGRRADSGPRTGEKCKRGLRGSACAQRCMDQTCRCHLCLVPRSDALLPLPL